MIDPKPMKPRSPDQTEWNIESVVAELHTIREASIAARRRTGKPIKLPSRKALSAIVEGLSAALFPNRLGSRQLAYESADYFVGHTLDLHFLTTGGASGWELVCSRMWLSGESSGYPTT